MLLPGEFIEMIGLVPSNANSGDTSLADWLLCSTVSLTFKLLMFCPENAFPLNNAPFVFHIMDLPAPDLTLPVSAL